MPSSMPRAKVPLLPSHSLEQAHKHADPSLPLTTTRTHSYRTQAEDDRLFDYLVDDGQTIEPKSYMQIVPLSYGAPFRDLDTELQAVP